MRIGRAFALACMTAGLLAFAAGPAAAHEIRNVGKYQFTVGFGNEPAYTGQENFVQFFLHDRATGKPVTNLGPSLKVEVIVGSQKKTLALEPSFDPDTGLGTPGEYDAFFFPTTPGKYTFHFFGSIGGQKIDQSFTSGPETFSLVEDPTTVEFPNKVPTTGDIAGLLRREIPRLTAQVADARSSLHSDVNTAKILGIVGIALGALGLGVGATGFAMSRRS
jgi:hypothetical protein